MKSLFSLISCIFGFFLQSEAQNTIKSHTVTLSINDILELDFTNSAQILGFTFTTADHFENGITNNAAAGLKVRSNKPWTVSVKANSPNFLASAGGETNISASTLSIRKNGTSNLIPLSNVEQTLATGLKGGFGLNTFSIDYLAKPGYIAPATYTLDITFTVTAP